MPRDHHADLSAITPVILAGGTGRRLWPLSTAVRPKPFLQLPGGQSFLQNTAARVAGMKAPFVVCNERHRALVMDQVQQADQIILEPMGRGTAPAVAAAAHYLTQKDDSLMLVMPSDHAIADPVALRDAVRQGITPARDGWLVTFGIKPRHASPHYGYIQAGDPLQDDMYEAGSFVEKPDRRAARHYLKEGHYFWNSGIFLFSAKTYLENLKKQQSVIYEASQSAVQYASRLQNSIFLNEKIFSACPALSIDYAVMENAPKCAVIPVSMGWRDLGTWPSLLTALIKN